VGSPTYPGVGLPFSSNIEGRGMTKTEKRVKFLWDIGHLLDHASEVGIKLICFTFYRSPEDQAIQVVEGKSNLRHGAHQEWLAMDLCVIKDGQTVWGRCSEYEKLGKVWKDMGNTWGGSWKSLNDIYHFELGGWDK
jgi:hypothetical protein